MAEIKAKKLKFRYLVVQLLQQVKIGTALGALKVLILWISVKGF